jgi:hypothetical protein
VAVKAPVAAVFHAKLDATEKLRPAEAGDTSRLPPLGWNTRDLRHRVGLGGAAQVVEQTVTGTITVWAFTGKSERRTVTSSAIHRAPLLRRERLEVGTMVGEAVRDVTIPAQAPRWDQVAKRLVSSGCPFLALALHDARVQPTPASKQLRQAALAAMAEPVRRAEQDAAEAAETDGTASDERYTCASLCELHMVELCNNDKELWNLHRTTWKPTPCGTRRSVPFLGDCYKEQWLTGAYHDSCVRPCESTGEGRDRLMAILHAAGCLRPGS